MRYTPNKYEQCVLDKLAEAMELYYALPVRKRPAKPVRINARGGLSVGNISPVQLIPLLCWRHTKGTHFFWLTFLFDRCLVDAGLAVRPREVNAVCPESDEVMRVFTDACNGGYSWRYDLRRETIRLHIMEILRVRLDFDMPTLLPED